MISDTTTEMDWMVLALRRKQTPGQRMPNALGMSELVRSLELGMPRNPHPDADERELRYSLSVKRYGRALEVAGPSMWWQGQWPAVRSESHGRRRISIWWRG